MLLITVILEKNLIQDVISTNVQKNVFLVLNIFQMEINAMVKMLHVTNVIVYFMETAVLKTIQSIDRKKMMILYVAM